MSLGSQSSPPWPPLVLTCRNFSQHCGGKWYWCLCVSDFILLPFTRVIDETYNTGPSSSTIGNPSQIPRKSYILAAQLAGPKPRVPVAFKKRAESQNADAVGELPVTPVLRRSEHNKYVLHMDCPQLIYKLVIDFHPQPKFKWPLLRRRTSKLGIQFAFPEG